MEIKYTFGTITDTLSDKAREITDLVDDCDELFTSGTQIYIPKIIGVSHATNNESPESPIYKLLNLLSRNNGNEFPKNMFAIIYNQQEMEENVLKAALPTSGIGRIKLCKYNEMPDFSAKPDVENARRALENYREAPKEEVMQHRLSAMNEELMATKGVYGLTKEESDILTNVGQGMLELAHISKTY